MEDSKYKFDVFLSYSRKDEDFGRKLEEALESYTLPKDVNSRSIARKRLNVFRDKKDLVPNQADYYQAIEGYLNQSRYLVVICSPNARSSPYVDAEIEAFLRSNEANRVIPVLLSGKPNNDSQAKPEEYAFPQALCDALAMPLAVDFTEFARAPGKLNKGRYHDSWYSLLAKIFGTERAEIERLDAKRQARRRAIFAGVSLAVIALLSVALVFAIIARQQAASERDHAQQLLYASDMNLAQRAFESERQRQSSVLSDEEGIQRYWQFVGGGAPQFSPDGKLLAVDYGCGVVGVYNAKSLIQVATLGDGPPASGCTSFVSFSPDGKILAYGNGYSASLWDTVTQKDLREPEQDVSLPDSIDQLESVAFSPDSRILAIGDRSKQIVLWNISTRKVLARLKGHDGWVSALAFSPDGKTLYSGGIDQTVKLWDLSSYQSEGKIDAEKIKPFATLKGHTDSILSIKCASTGKVVATVGTDRTVKLWADTAGREFEKFDNVSGVFPRAYLAVTNVGDGYDNRVTAVDLGAQMQSLPAKLDQTPTIVSADRKLFAFESGILSGTESRAMDLVEPVSGHKLASIPSRFLRNFASFSHDSRSFGVIGPDNKSVMLWDTVERRDLPPIKNDVELRSFLMSPGGKLLVTFDKESGTVKSWEIVSKRRVAQFVRNRNATNSEDEAPDESDPQVLSPDGQVLAFSDSSKVELWQVNSNDAPLALANSDMRGPVSVIAFSPDGKLLAAGDEIGTVRIWDAVKRQELTTFMGHKDSVTTLAFSPDSRALASGGAARDGAVKLYGMTTMRELLTLTHEPSPTSETHAGQGSEDDILQLFFSADGRALITHSGNFILRIWRGNVPQT